MSTSTQREKYVLRCMCTMRTKVSTEQKEVGQGFEEIAELVVNKKTHKYYLSKLVLKNWVNYGKIFVL